METETTSPEVSLDTWAVIELFGHTRVAGKITNVSIAGCGFIRVEVPAYQGLPAYTRDIAPKAVYAINPCDEAAAVSALSYCSASPVVALCQADIANAYAERRRTIEAAPALGAGDDEDDYVSGE